MEPEGPPEYLGGGKVLPPVRLLLAWPAWGLSFPAGPRTSALRMEEESRGLCGKLWVFGKHEAVLSVLFLTHPTPLGLVIDHCWPQALPFSFLISYHSLSSPSLITSAWILQQPPSEWTICLCLFSAPCHLHPYLDVSSWNISIPNPTSFSASTLRGWSTPWSQTKIVIFLPWFQPSCWVILIFSCYLILSHSTRLTSNKQ